MVSRVIADATEEWRPIPGWEGLYEASNLARIRRVAPRLMGTNINNFGYEVLALKKDGKPHKRSVHRLVAEAFLGPCPDGMQVNHMDGNKLNNLPNNLEYCTGAENTQHAARRGLLASGVKHWKAKLTERDVLEIRALDGHVDRAELSATYGVSRPVIVGIQKRTMWKHLPEDGLDHLYWRAA